MGNLNWRSYIVILLVVWGCSTEKGFSQEIPEIEKLSEVDGDFQPIKGVGQDKEGNLWIASVHHIEKYNAGKSQFFNRFKGLPKNTGAINTVYVDSRENVWVGAETGLLKYDPSKKLFLSVPSERSTKTNVQQITEDASGDIFMGSSSGIWKYSGNEMVLVTFFPSDQSVNEFIFANDQLIFGTSMGLFTMNSKSKDYKKINFYNQQNINVQSLVFTGDSYLIGTKEDGLYKTPSDFSGIEKLNRLPLSSQELSVSGLAIDNSGYIYVATTGDGLLLLDKNFNLVSQFMQQDYNSLSLSDNDLSGVFLGNSNTLWVYTATGQINALSLKERNFEFIRHDPKKYSSLADNYTTAIEEDVNGNVWIGNRQGLSILNASNNTWQHIKSLSFSKSTGVPDVIKDLQADGIHMWVATYNDGVYKVNVNTLLRAHYSTDSKVKTDLQKVKTLLVDSNRNVWAGGEEGGLTQISSNGKIKTIALQEIDAIIELSSGDFIAAGKEGVFRILNGNYKIQPVTKISPNAKDLPYFTVNAIAETREGNIILATEGAGIIIYDPTKDFYTTINKTGGLPSNRVQSLIVEGSGIWAGTSKGLVNFEIEKKPEIRVYDKDDGLLSQVFIRGSFARLENKLAFGTFKGVSLFSPAKLKLVPENIPSVILGAVELHSKNKELQTLDNMAGEDLSLKHDQNSLSFNFSGISSGNEAGIDYSWMLQGFDTDWSQPSSQKEVTYANLAPGDYKFLVKAKTSNGKWSPTQEIAMNIQSPWWLSTGAYIGYGSAALLLLVLVPLMGSSTSKRKRSGSGKSVSRKYMNQELGTSLNTILASLENLAEEENSDKKIGLQNIVIRLKELLDPILKLQNLVSAETDHAPVISQISIPEYFEILVMDFQPLLRKKKLKIILNDQWTPDKFYYDKKYLNKIFSTIISSSINYSFEEGKIIINLIQTNRGDLKVQLADNGSGLPYEDQKIIKEYFRDSKHNPDKKNLNSIDLLNVKDYLNKLGGSIVFESSKDQGTTFTLILNNQKESQVRQETKLSQAYLDLAVKEEQLDVINRVVQPEKEISSPTILGERKILIAEDNDELRKVFVAAFRSLGEVYEAKNGTEAYSLAVKIQPEILIADFKMPDMNGVSLNTAIKKNPDLAQIALYLMISPIDKMDFPHDSNLGVLHLVSKPVNIDSLLQIIKDQLETPQSQPYQNANLSQRNSQLLKGNFDKDFIEKLENIILENLSNSTFSVEDLSKLAGANIEVLSYKIKGEKGVSAQEFIFHTKLDYARLLLSKGKSDLSEVARQTGFANKDIFFSSYKKHFGFMPGTIIEK